MKVKLEVLVEAIKRVVEAGREEELMQMARKDKLIVTVNQDLVKKVKTRMIRSTAATFEGSREGLRNEFTNFDECRT